jgi:hypothetical protein
MLLKSVVLPEFGFPAKAIFIFCIDSPLHLSFVTDHLSRQEGSTNEVGPSKLQSQKK